MHVFRDFIPAEPELQLAIQSGALIFRTQAGGLMICRQIPQATASLALVERITWQNDPGSLLETAEAWQQGSRLSMLLIVIQETKEIQLLRELGYEVKTLTATVAIKKGIPQKQDFMVMPALYPQPQKGESIHVSYPTSEPPVEAVPQQSDAENRRERDGVALRRAHPPGKSDRPTLNIGPQRKRGRPTRSVPTATGLSSSSESMEG